MALRLNRRTDPEWVDIGRGAAVQTLPPSTPIVYAARARADALLIDLLAAGEAVTKAGGHIVGAPDLGSEEGLAGARHSLFVVSLAEIAVIDWRGILDDPDDPDAPPKPRPFDAALLAMLMADPAVADAFQTNYQRPLHEVVLEGNV